MHNMQRQSFRVSISMVTRAASPRASWTLLEAYFFSTFPRLRAKKAIQKKYHCDRQESCILYQMCLVQLVLLVEYLIS